MLEIASSGAPFACQGRGPRTKLNAHATPPELVYANHRRIGNVVMWHNGFLAHRRHAFDPAQNRRWKRLTLKLSPARTAA